jgi:hypothetical protein
MEQSGINKLPDCFVFYNDVFYNVRIFAMIKFLYKVGESGGSKSNSHVTEACTAVTGVNSNVNSINSNVNAGQIEFLNF